MMKVLVTGANGFIGRPLCQYLAFLGHDVVPTVRHSSGLSNERIVNDQASWLAALEGCASVVHLAARAHVMNDKETNTLNSFRINNVDTTLELATRAVESGVQRFVFISTVKVNGEFTVAGTSLTPEDPYLPKDPYAISKCEAEMGLLDLARNTNLQVVIIRSPIVYGPGVKGNIASLIKWIKHGFPLPLGAVDNRRSMIALDNLVHFIALCADSLSSPTANGQVFMVSDGENISTRDLSLRIAKAYGCKIRLISVPVGLMRFMALCTGKSSHADRLFGSLVIDDSKARQMLKWHPPSDMDEQLKKMALNDSCI